MGQVGSLTYFVPDNSNAVGVFKADAQEYVEVDAWPGTLTVHQHVPTLKQRDRFQ